MFRNSRRNSEQVELKDLGEASLSKTESSFNYTYKKTNRFPLNKKDFFEAALSRNKQELDQPLIEGKNNDDDDIGEKNNNQMIDKVNNYIKLNSDFMMR